jgi:hypothetical protein
MADHYKAQNAKQTNEAAHQRRGAEPVHQEWTRLEQADQATLQRAVANPGLARPADILGLQRAYGNQAVTRLIQAFAPSTALAQSFTHGQDIHFGAGRYDPGIAAGKRLLAPKLIHVAQQMEGVLMRRQGENQSEPARTSAAPGTAIQREMWTRENLEREGGPPGWWAKKHDSTYTQILEDLQYYHEKLESPSGTSGATRRLSHLGLLKDKAISWMAKRAGGGKRRSALWTLKNRIDEEIELIRQSHPNVEGYGGYGALGTPSPAGVEVTREPGLEASFKQSTTIYKDQDMSARQADATKGELCIRHEADKPNVLYVEKYKYKKKEGGREKEIEWDENGKGYVSSAMVTGSKYKHEALGKDIPLFTREPNIDDIKQGGIGDCFLLAALISIVNKDPTYFYKMIRDNRDGTVTVRLYDITRDSPQETHLTINKSLISGDRYSRRAGTLWVPLIEKAYAAMGVSAVKTSTGLERPGEVSRSYHRLGEGGRSDIAFAILLGRSGGEKLTIAETQPWRPPVSWTMGGQVQSGLARAPWNSAVPGSFDTLRRLQGKVNRSAFDNDRIQEKRAELTLVYEIFNAHENLIKQWCDFVRTADIDNKLKNIRDRRHREPRVEDFTSFLTGLDAAVKNPVLQWAQDHCVFPGQRSTGNYSSTQIEMLWRIDEALAAGKYVAAGTFEKVGRKATGRGHSAGEEESKGLVGSHAYAILGMKWKGGLTYITLANPWGEYGRIYREKKGRLVAEKTQKGQFDLELCDFTKRFDRLYVSG